MNSNNHKQDSQGQNRKLAGTPLIPKQVYNSLPELLKTCVDQFEDPRERDVVLTGCFVTLSGCFVGVHGKYQRDIVGPNLYCFVVAPAASGKGAAKYPRMLGLSIQDKLLAKNQRSIEAYQAKMKLWEKDLKEKKDGITGPPPRPRYPVLFLPGNTSAAAIYNLLHESDGVGMMYETEADTLSGSLKQDWGSFSDMLRKAFHHEPLSLSRKTDSEYKEIQHPHLSIFLTGTPDQVPRLIKSAEDGLCSRFMFYVYAKELEWQDVTPCDVCPDVSELFYQAGKEVEEISNWLKEGGCRFSLSKNQFAQLNAHFNDKIELIKKFGGGGTAAATYRLSLICFRIAMILTVCRQFRPDREDRHMVCTDEDFNTALELVDVYFQHAMVMLSLLPQHTKSNLDPKLGQFYSFLPADTHFSKGEAIAKGRKVGISERTVTNYLDKLKELRYIRHLNHGSYQKTE